MCQTNAMLVPTFEPGVDDVNIYTGKVELLLSTWPKTKIAELGTRLILGCRGSLFLKLQLYRDEICVNDPKGIKKLISLVGGSWGQVPLERKFELAEKALYKCVQKTDESSDSYLTRCEVVWTELLARNVKLEELQAYIMLRGSRLNPDDKKRVIVDAGAESGGSREMTKVTAAVRMLGSTFFQEMSGVRREKTLKVYDHQAFLAEEPEDYVEQETLMATDENFDDEALEALAADQDDDAMMVLQFEDAIMDTISADQELSTFFSSYQDARRRLTERGKVRGFWPVRKSFDKGKKGSKGKGKGRGGQSLASRIANSYCRICFKRGHWKDECPNNPNKTGHGASSNPTVAPTSFASVQELPPEFSQLPFEAQVSWKSSTEHVFFGVVNDNHYTGEGYRGHVIAEIKRKLCQGMKHCLRYRRSPSEAIDPKCVNRVTAKGDDNNREPQGQITDSHRIRSSVNQGIEDVCFASTGTTGVVDLGASQTVIGSQQIPELLERLPPEIRNQVKRTNCNLIFRFGNHQTLTSHHALLLPIADSWFRVAVVKGNTPFLLSSDFLRKTLKAIIDTEKGTIWSKALNRDLKIEITPKNLFLMDIVQLWETPGNTLPVLASQAQVTVELPRPFDAVKTQQPPESTTIQVVEKETHNNNKTETETMRSHNTDNIDMSSHITAVSQLERQSKSNVTDRFQCEGPSSQERRECSNVVTSRDCHVVGVPALQGVSEDPQQIEKDSAELEAVRWMSLQDLSQETISFGNKKIGMKFEDAFTDGAWTDWFISHYEHSPKVAHRKYIRYVELRLNAEINAENTETTKRSTTTPKMTAAKSKPATAKPQVKKEKAPSVSSWNPVDIEDLEESEEETTKFALMHLEEEVVFMRQENRQLNDRLSGLEGVLQEVITHLKQQTVKEEK